jgi:hypothetical protein
MAIAQYLSNSSNFVFKGFPAQTEVEKSLVKIRARFGEGIGAQELGKYDLEEVYLEVKEKWERGKDLSGLSLRTLKRVPFVLFRNNLGSSTLGNDQSLLLDYLIWLKKTSNSRAVVSLLSEFLYKYDPKASWFEMTRTSLNEILSSANSIRLSKLRNLVYKYHLLEVGGPNKLMDLALLNTSTIEVFLYGAGLSGRLSNRGIAEHVFISISQDIRGNLLSKLPILAALDKLTVWFVPGKGEFRFPERKAEFVNNLLEPFSNSDSPESAKENIFTFLMDNFGDPRINKGHWEGVSAIALQVMKRWLVKSTLEDFFRLLKHVAGNDPQTERMWKDRQKFWTAYIKRNVISEAWVVLGNKARQVAKSSFSDFNGQYGNLTSANVAPLHSALLMKIDTLVIAEWSHNGKCHIWMDTDNNKPTFYENRYSRDELRNENSNSPIESPPFTHVNSNHPLWQRRIRDYIRKITGIDVPDREFS